MLIKNTFTILLLIIILFIILFNLTINKNQIKSLINGYDDKLSCPDQPEVANCLRSVNTTSLTYDEVLIALAAQGIEEGGAWKPNECHTRHHVAILIPYRSREAHLNTFLLNMHPLFAKQKLAYKIYLIEPVASVKFNRGLLLNIGFLESNKDAEWDCHAYHDVDLISESDCTSYQCPRDPTHMAHYIKKYNYPEYFGGVTILRKEHYVLANGYSNLYFGWGAEDDDHRARIIAKNMTIVDMAQYPIGKYTMLGHNEAEKNR